MLREQVSQIRRSILLLRLLIFVKLLHHLRQGGRWRNWLIYLEIAMRRRIPNREEIIRVTSLRRRIANLRGLYNRVLVWNRQELILRLF